MLAPRTAGGLVAGVSLDHTLPFHDQVSASSVLLKPPNKSVDPVAASYTIAPSERPEGPLTVAPTCDQCAGAVTLACAGEWNPINDNAPIAATEMVTPIRRRGVKAFTIIPPNE